MTNQRRLILIIIFFAIFQSIIYLFYVNNAKKETLMEPLIEPVACSVEPKKEDLQTIHPIDSVKPEVLHEEKSLQSEQNSFEKSGYKIGFKNLSEELSLENLEVQGNIPFWLSGSLIFNGPAYLAKCDKDSSWFDALAMLYKFNFDQGKVSYKNRFIKSKNYYEAFSKKNPLLKDIKINNANLNVAKVGNKFVALSEIPLPVIFDPKTLKTDGSFKFNDSLPIDKIFECSNPIYDHDKNETINFLINLGAIYSNYEIYKIDNGSSQRKIIATISVKEPSYVHNFSITDNYIILAEYPFVVKPYKLALSGTMIDKFNWKPEKGTNFYVINRNTSQVNILNTMPFYAFHHINAFEENNKLTVDIVRFPTADIIKKFGNLQNKLNIEKYDPEIESDIIRFKIDLKKNVIEDQILNKKSIIFPEINEKYRKKIYNFIYATAMEKKEYYDDLNQIVKIDLNTGELKYWNKDYCYPSQPIFVALPNAQEEDEGVVMSVILDSKKEKSFLLILDAQTFEEIANVPLPHHIPFGLHGHFFNSIH